MNTKPICLSNDKSRRKEFFKKNAETHWNAFMNNLDALNKEFPKLDTRWEIDENTGKVRRVKMPSMEWEPFEEANDELD